MFFAIATEPFRAGPARTGPSAGRPRGAGLSPGRDPVAGHTTKLENPSVRQAPTTAGPSPCYRDRLPAAALATRRGANVLSPSLPRTGQPTGPLPALPAAANPRRTPAHPPGRSCLPSRDLSTEACSHEGRVSAGEKCRGGRECQPDWGTSLLKGTEPESLTRHRPNDEKSIAYLPSAAKRFLPILAR